MGLLTVCLTCACCSKVGRIIKGMCLYFLWHYIQWQPGGLMSARLISTSVRLCCLFSFFFSPHPHPSPFTPPPVMDQENSLCITSAEIIPFITWWKRRCVDAFCPANNCRRMWKSNYWKVHLVLFYLFVFFHAPCGILREAIVGQ